MPSKRKKVLYIITKSNFGGAQRNVFELATHLPKDTYEVCVAFGGNGLLKEKLEAAGIATHTISAFERDVSLFKDVRAYFELRALMRALRPDVVHLHSSKAGGIGALIARMCGVPNIIFTAHGWPFFEDRNVVWKSLVWLLSWCTALLSHKVILVSEHDYKQTHMPFVKKKCVVIKTAIEQVSFHERTKAREVLFSEKELARHADDLYLVTIAELTKNKNILTAIQAVAKYNETCEKKIFYTIIGDGELRESLTTYIASHNLTDGVKLQGYVDNARAYLKAFDIFLLPSLKEGTPYALLEAGAAGLPAIASDVGGMSEILGDTTHGMLVNPNDTASIVAGLHTYADNMDAARARGSALVARIKNEYGAEQMLARTYALYESISLAL